MGTECCHGNVFVRHCYRAHNLETVSLQNAEVRVVFGYPAKMDPASLPRTPVAIKPTSNSRKYVGVTYAQGKVVVATPEDKGRDYHCDMTSFPEMFTKARAKKPAEEAFLKFTDAVRTGEMFDATGRVKAEFLDALEGSPLMPAMVDLAVEKETAAVLTEATAAMPAKVADKKRAFLDFVAGEYPDADAEEIENGWNLFKDRAKEKVVKEVEEDVTLYANVVSTMAKYTYFGRRKEPHTMVKYYKAPGVEGDLPDDEAK